MASRNPVLIRATGESFGGETIEQGSLNQPVISGARLTMDDVIVKTGMLFALLLAGAFVGWSAPGLTFVAFFIGLGLAFANIFKKQVSPGLVLAYGAAEGVFLGGLSKMYATAYAYAHEHDDADGMYLCDHKTIQIIRHMWCVISCVC
jgi:uncharacterized YccA/Bax inhibitor family protein